MTITVRSPRGVYYRTDVPTDLEAALAADETMTDRERVERGLAALAWHEEGYSYSQIASWLEVSTATAIRWVQDARRRYRKAAAALGAELAS